MPIITFIRHAETVYNANKIFAGRIDCELSEKGIQDTIKKFNFKPTFPSIISYTTSKFCQSKFF